MIFSSKFKLMKAQSLCKIPLIVLLINLSSIFATPTTPHIEKPTIGSPTVSDEELITRLKSISGPVGLEYDESLKEQFLRYVTPNTKGNTERMLGLGKVFFPIFEKHLRKNGLPASFKYLPMVESGFESRAYSYAGAAGLWQIIPSTGKILGLQMNELVDERLDIHKSTEAAIKLLKTLYRQYGDWGLALAAYNCGQVRINAALSHSSEKTFWAIRTQLPRETQKYVPTFLAAVYAAKFYKSHNLHPAPVKQEYTRLDTIHIQKYLSFSSLSERTGISVEAIKFLNPSYLRMIIPANKNGNIVTLPAEAVSRLKGTGASIVYSSDESLDELEDAVVSNTSNLVNTSSKASYVNNVKASNVNNVKASTERVMPAESVSFYHKVERGQTLADVAKAYAVTEETLVEWNPGIKSKIILPVGAKIAFRQAYSSVTASSSVEIPEVDKTAKRETDVLHSAKSSKNSKGNLTVLEKIVAPRSASAEKLVDKAKRPANNSKVFHIVKNGENLSTIAKKYDGVSTKSLVQLNGQEKIKRLQIGDKIVIK
jgi:membrane-bound lytic murein transglycosylase D